MGASARLRSRWFTTIGPVLTVADIGAVLLAGLVAGATLTGASLVPVLLAALAATVAARGADLHRSRLVLSIAEDLPGLLVAAAAATVVLVVTHQAAAIFAVLVLAMLVLAHTVVYGTTHLLRQTGRLRRRVLVVGTGATARQLTQTLLVRPDLGLTPVGMVATGPRRPLAQARGLPLPLLGRLQTLPWIMTEAGVDTVVFALPDPATDAEKAAIDGCLSSSADVYAVPTHFPAAEARARHSRELVAGIALVHAYRRPAWAPVRAGRRLTALPVALVTMAAVRPLAALVAVLPRSRARRSRSRADPPGSAGAPSRHQAQVDPGQLTA